MTDTIIKITKIDIRDFKSIHKGSIDLVTKNSKDNIIGIYGQNGSGKSSVIDALNFFRLLASGGKLPKDTIEYIRIGALELSINCEFLITHENEKFHASYSVTIAKKNGKAILKSEKLTSRDLMAATRSRRTIISYNYQDTDSSKPAFSPSVRYDELVGRNNDLHVDMQVVSKLIQKGDMLQSFIFHEDVLELFYSSELNNRDTEILRSLKYFATVRLMIIRSGRLQSVLNSMLVFSFCHETEEVITAGGISVSIKGPSEISEENYGLLEHVINQMNIVLRQIVPELTVQVHDFGKQLNTEGNPIHRIELFTLRKSTKISLKHESEGIIRIISIMSALISMYNNSTYCLAVDELDAGIFEYLLGELLSIIEKEAKGQLIFTSHNLRPLEMLSKKCLIFSTINPDNRFVRLENIGATNNLRSVYLRGIDLGGLNEPVYEETDSYEIAHALRVAGEYCGKNEED